MVPSDATLQSLHYLLQIVMGWNNSHLHMFTVKGKQYGEPDPISPSPLADERKVKLSQVAPSVGAKLTYEYDFGDSWQHTIAVEKISAEDPAAPAPFCVDGARACPPEDCGGIWGYADLLQTVSDPEHPDHADQIEWLGPNFDPELFDADRTNQGLRRIRG